MFCSIVNMAQYIENTLIAHTLLSSYWSVLWQVLHLTPSYWSVMTPPTQYNQRFLYIQLSFSTSSLLEFHASHFSIVSFQTSYHWDMDLELWHLSTFCFSGDNLYHSCHSLSKNINLFARIFLRVDELLSQPQLNHNSTQQNISAVTNPTLTKLSAITDPILTKL